MCAPKMGVVSNQKVEKYIETVQINTTKKQTQKRKLGLETGLCYESLNGNLRLVLLHQVSQKH